MTIFPRTRTFLVGKKVFDVIRNDIDDSNTLPPTYLVDDGEGIRCMFFHEARDSHFEILLAALDHLEEKGELDGETRTTPTPQIMEV